LDAIVREGGASRGQREAGSWKLVAESWRLGAESWRLGAGDQNRSYPSHLCSSSPLAVAAFTYIGPWLPEPVDTSSDPLLGAVRGEALQFAVLLLLEKLSPAERAAYVLREAFEYPYREIAEILQLEEANTRQLVARARHHIANGRHQPVSPGEQRRLLETFIAAAREGDLAALEGLFAANVVSRSDGGGEVRAARVPIAGRERVAKFIAAFASHFWTGVTLQWMETNGQPSVLITRERETIAVASVDASAEGAFIKFCG
jgi:RNA polymerase sigma-70 factor (ECF subfamily)